MSALKWFRPARKAGAYDDLAALRTLVTEMLRNFPEGDRLMVKFPVKPHDDLLARMNAQQMGVFRGHLVKLAALLEEAERGGVGPLRKAFGPDFPER